MCKSVSAEGNFKPESSLRRIFVFPNFALARFRLHTLYPSLPWVLYSCAAAPASSAHIRQFPLRP